MKKTLAIVATAVLATLFVTGCINLANTSPSPTSASSTPLPTTATTDYSSYYNQAYEGGGSLVTQPFTKATNVRGNEVYMGIIKNATLAGAVPWICVVELANSQAQAKQIYDGYVTAKQNEGFTLRSDVVTQSEASALLKPNEMWAGENGAAKFVVSYRFDGGVHSWPVTTEITE